MYFFSAKNFKKWIVRRRKETFVSLHQRLLNEIEQMSRSFNKKIKEKQKEKRTLNNLVSFLFFCSNFIL